MYVGVPKMQFKPTYQSKVECCCMVYHGPLRIRVSTATMGCKLNRSLLHYGKYIFLLLFNKHKFDIVRPFDQQIQLMLHSFIITSRSFIYYSFNLVALFW